MSFSPEPLRFERRFLEKVWGGRALERRPGIELPPGVQVGETWELVDREDENSVVAEGTHRGRTLRELMRLGAGAILGRSPAAGDGRFPLLVKYLDASQNLSVQVHPDEEAARALANGAEAKTEAWYVVDARPGSVLYAGLRPGITAQDFRRVADGPGVVETLLSWPIERGDCLLVPGGTVHAISAGVTILEVQQNSDTTYRLWDWGRSGRETHVEEALRCIRFGAPGRPPLRAEWLRDAEGVQTASLARSRHFEMNALRLLQPARRATDGRYQIYVVVEGRGRLLTRAAGEPERECRLRPGDVWLVPAACGDHRLEPAGGELTLVHVLHRPEHD